MDRINVRVDAHLKQKLDAEARDRRVSQSAIVREALENHLKSKPRRQTCLEIARRIGLIGSAKGLPEDLSTNRDHLEGFGRD